MMGKRKKKILPEGKFSPNRQGTLLLGDNFKRRIGKREKCEQEWLAYTNGKSQN
jgi:hypothetical protein